MLKDKEKHSTMDTKKIKNALVSVFYKDGLEDIVRALDRNGVTIYSTGGTYKFIKDLGIEAVTVESLTGYPSILGGRVKTLHPKVFGGILSRRDMFSDGEQLSEYQIPEIDLVIVDLYPFEQTVASGAAEQDIIEKIDIGGISLIRAAAKNYKDVVIVPSVDRYAEFLKIYNEQDGCTTLADRHRFAAYAFAVSSHYDTAIFNHFNEEILQQFGRYRRCMQPDRRFQADSFCHPKAQQRMWYGMPRDVARRLEGRPCRRPRKRLWRYTGHQPQDYQRCRRGDAQDLL